MKEKTLTIKPVTRVEGHAKVSIFLNEQGQVDRATLNIMEFRGFEKFLEGRPIEEAPNIVTRICGICPVSHHLVSAKACDRAVGVSPTETATKLRELMHMGQYIHNHPLHILFLGGPDFLLEDVGPTERNMVGLLKAHPELASKAIEVRAFGQKIVEIAGGSAIHPTTSLPGGISKHPGKGRLENLKGEIGSVKNKADQIISAVEKGVEKKFESLLSEDSWKSYYMALNRGGNFELYDGNIRIIGKDGAVEEDFEASDYPKRIEEHVEGWSYTRFPYYKKEGWPDGVYRVGPLARINVAENIEMPKAAAKLKEIRSRFGHPLHDTFHYNTARLMELIYAIEKAEAILSDDSILHEDVRTPFEFRRGEGVAAIEAPRGTLIHHYKVNDHGIITGANIIVATTHNNGAMNRSVLNISKRLVKGEEVDYQLANKIESVIRHYDPCLSCSTHLDGRFKVEIALIDNDGRLLQTLRN